MYVKDTTTCEIKANSNGTYIVYDVTEDRSKMGIKVSRIFGKGQIRNAMRFKEKVDAERLAWNALCENKALQKIFEYETDAKLNTLLGRAMRAAGVR